MSSSPEARSTLSFAATVVRALRPAIRRRPHACGELRNGELASGRDPACPPSPRDERRRARTASRSTRFAAGALDEPARGLDLRRHRAGGEVRAPQLCGRRGLDRPRRRRAPVAHDVRDVRREHERSAPSDSASSAAVRSLSITASTPRSPSPSRDDRDAAAAGADDDAPEPTRRSIASSSTISFRLGRGDDAAEVVRRRGDRPAALARRARCASRSEYTGPIGFVGCAKAGSSRVDEHLRQQRDDVALGELVAERLDEQVADHPLALRAEDVERVRRHGLVRLRFEREQPDLRAVAVRDDELVASRPARRGRRRPRGRVPSGSPPPPARRAAAGRCRRVRRRFSRAAHRRRVHRRVRARRSASSVGIRFADCCQTTDCGPSMTAAATSSPRLAGQAVEEDRLGLRERHQLLGHLERARAPSRVRPVPPPRPSRPRRRRRRRPRPRPRPRRGRGRPVSSAPESPARAAARSRRRRGSGVYSGGQAIVRSRPASAPTSSSECATLSPPSPTNASAAPGDVAEHLLDREQVRQRLARMVLVGERVDDRHRRPARQLVDRLLRERADHDRGDVAGERASGVGDRLAAAELQLLRRQRDRRRAEPGSRRRERDPCPCRRLLEDAGDRPAAKRVLAAGGRRPSSLRPARAARAAPAVSGRRRG